MYFNGDKAWFEQHVSVTLPSLQELTINIVAIALGNHIDINRLISENRNADDEKWLALLLSEVSELANELPLPKPITKYLKFTVEFIYDMMNEWATYHFDLIFHRRGIKNDLFCFFGDVFWNPDGIVNGKETARNLSTSRRLSSVEKFRFLCAYSLKPEIDEMWSWFRENNIVFHIDFESDPLVWYWYCYLNVELGNLTVELEHMKAVALQSEMSVDRFMCQSDDVPIQTALDYFFNRMNEYEQMQCAVWLIDEFGEELQHEVLMKLNADQLLQMHYARGVQIMINYAYAEDRCDDVLFTWYCIRDLLYTPYQFAELFKELIKTAASRSVLREIWISARTAYRNLLLVDYDIHEIIETILNKCKKEPTRDDIDLLLAVLSYVHVSDKKMIVGKESFFECCESLLTAGKITMLEQLWRMCFYDHKELLIFKRDLTRREFFGRYCEELALTDSEKASTLRYIFNIALCY